DAATRQEIQRGDALGDAMRLVGGELDHAVTEPDVLRALAGGAEGDFGRRRVRILLEEMMLDLPGVVVGKLVGELDLGERILQELVFALRSPRARALMLVEDAELHGCFLFSVMTRSCRTSQCGRPAPAPAAAGSRGPSRDRSAARRRG